MKQHNAMTVAHVECFLLVAVLQEHDSAVRQNAVAVHQEQLDALRARIDGGGFLFHDLFPYGLTKWTYEMSDRMILTQRARRFSPRAQSKTPQRFASRPNQNCAY